MNDHYNMMLEAKALVHTEPDEALRICSTIMNDDMDGKYGQMALFMSGFIMMEAERYGLAYHMYQRCAQLKPGMSEIWSNMAMCIEGQPKKALKLFEKAIKLDPKNGKAYANAGLLYLHANNPGKAIKMCEKALELDPDGRAARHNLGLSKLMLRNPKGWLEYEASLGIKYREKSDYGVPDWDYKSKGKILVYGEQGVGDEIMFATILPDLMKDYDVVFDTDKRLHSLFDRTFDCPVYGTRFESESPIRKDLEIDYQVAIGQLPSLYRLEGQYPGKAYLKTDPDQDLQWRALFDSFPGKKIGVAFSGGGPDTMEDRRSFSLEDFSPLFNSEDTFVSLEYKPLSDENLETAEKYGVKSYSRVTGKGLDIDPLASLVSQLDYVVTSCTTVVYVAGALGVPCFVLTPHSPSYRYHVDGDEFEWFDSVKLVRQKKGQSWLSVVKSLKENDHVENIHRFRSSGNYSVSRMRTVNPEACNGPSDVLPGEHQAATAIY